MENDTISHEVGHWGIQTEEMVRNLKPMRTGKKLKKLKHKRERSLWAGQTNDIHP